ncbi:MAG: hypothetical protein FD124_3579, partial [Alphaproteobacteria bacterium]
PPARKAADVYGGVQARRAGAMDQMPPPALTRTAPAVGAYDEPRPTFARGKEEKQKGGFNLFGWMNGAGEEPRQQPPMIEHEPQDVHDDHPPNDEDLEIPAFLRRQMTPR